MGGIGDSGTRAIAYIVTQMGVWMGKFGVTVKKDSRDSKLFINGMTTFACDADNNIVENIEKSYSFYGKSIGQCKSANYRRNCVEESMWNMGVQWSSSILRTMLNHTLVYTKMPANKDKYPYGQWGFKHPRSAFVLPYFSYVTGNKMK